MRILWFTAEWCGPCKKMKPVVEKIESEMEGVTFVRLDIDTEDGAAAAKEFDVLNVPTFLRLAEGPEQIVTHEVKGAQPPMRFKEWLGL